MIGSWKAKTLHGPLKDKHFLNPIRFQREFTSNVSLGVESPVTG